MPTADRNRISSRGAARIGGGTEKKMDAVSHRLFHSRNPAAFGHEIRQQRIFLRGGKP